MTVVSPIDGIVVERDVVPGNFYDMTNIMLTISPMTELWVWGNVFESDQDKVHIGQKWDILFQFSKEKFEGKVESIANGVDPETRTLRIRASIPNPGKHLKARMLVRAILQIPPAAGRHRHPPQRPVGHQRRVLRLRRRRGSRARTPTCSSGGSWRSSRRTATWSSSRRGSRPARGSSATAR